MLTSPFSCREYSRYTPPCAFPDQRGVVPQLDVPSLVSSRRILAFFLVQWPPMNNFDGLKTSGDPRPPPAIRYMVNQVLFFHPTVWALNSFALECLRCLPLPRLRVLLILSAFQILSSANPQTAQRPEHRRSPSTRCRKTPKAQSRSARFLRRSQNSKTSLSPLA